MKPHGEIIRDYQGRIKTLRAEYQRSKGTHRVFYTFRLIILLHEYASVMQSMVVGILADDLAGLGGKQNPRAAALIRDAKDTLAEIEQITMNIE